MRRACCGESGRPSVDARPFLKTETRFPSAAHRLQHAMGSNRAVRPCPDADSNRPSSIGSLRWWCPSSVAGNRVVLEIGWVTSVCRPANREVVGDLAICRHWSAESARSGKRIRDPLPINLVLMSPPRFAYAPPCHGPGQQNHHEQRPQRPLEPAAFRGGGHG